MKSGYLWLMIFFVLVLLGSKSFACQCMGTQKTTVEFRKTPVVFIGTVKSVNSADNRKFGDEYNFNNLRTTFVVDEAFKGVKTGSEIDIYTSSQGTACGIGFQEGKQVLVYAYDSGSERKYYSTSICTRTRLAHDKEDEIAVLRSLSKGNFVPRIYGRVEEIVRGIFLLDNKENAPMPNIRVFATNGTNVYQSVTDKKGNFRFVNIRPGNYRLDVKLPSTHKLGDDSWHFIEKNGTNYNYLVTNDDCPDFITIETRVDGRIKGRVIDFQGNPVGKNVNVTLITKETVNNPDDKIQYISTETDKKGFYEFVGIPEGEYFLGINLDLRQPYKNNPYTKTFYPNVNNSESATLIKLGYAQRLNGFNIALPPPLKFIKVKVKVTRNDGSPVVGMTAYVSNQARYDFEDFVWLKTDQNGEFTANCLEGVTYRFAIFEKDSKGYDQESAEVIQKIDGQAVKSIEFVVRN